LRVTASEARKLNLFQEFGKNMPECRLTIGFRAVHVAVNPYQEDTKKPNDILWNKNIMFNNVEKMNEKVLVIQIYDKLNDNSLIPIAFKNILIGDLDLKTDVALEKEFTLEPVGEIKLCFLLEQKVELFQKPEGIIQTQKDESIPQNIVKQNNLIPQETKDNIPIPQINLLQEKNQDSGPKDNTPFPIPQDNSIKDNNPMPNIDPKENILIPQNKDNNSNTQDKNIPIIQDNIPKENINEIQNNNTKSQDNIPIPQINLSQEKNQDSGPKDNTPVPIPQDNSIKDNSIPKKSQRKHFNSSKQR